MRPGWLVVFAKVPVAGRVKTRLTPPFTPQQAAAFYRCLLADALDVSSASARMLGLEAVLCVDPPPETASLVAQAPRGMRAIAQQPGPLDVRMTRAAQQGFAAGAPFVMLRGSDSPCLGESAIGDAVAALARADLVIRPDRDGGYDLVALGPAAGRAVDALFGHPMSTPTVLRDTLDHAGRLALRSELLATGFDVDRFDDLRWLAAARHADASMPCPRTLAFLDEHRLWPAPASPRDASVTADG